MAEYDFLLESGDRLLLESGDALDLEQSTTGAQSITPTGPTVPVTAGTPALALLITPTGPTVTVTVGTPAPALSIAPTGPTVTVTAGTATVVYDQLIAPTGPTVTVTAGTAAFSAQQLIAPTGPTVIVTAGTANVTDSYGDRLPYVAISPSFSGREIRNRISVTRMGGVAQVAADTTSIEAYGVREYSRSTLASTDADSALAAAWLLARYKEPLLRFDGLTIKPRSEPSTLFVQALSRDIGDRITIIRTPQGVGSVVTKQVIVEGVSHTITPDEWVTAYNLSPVNDSVDPY